MNDIRLEINSYCQYVRLCVDIKKLYTNLLGSTLLKLNRLYRWILKFGHWIAEAKIAFMCILVLVAAISFCIGPWCDEVSIRFAGYVLQVIGMIFAIRGLLGVRAHFGQPHLKQLLLEWLKRFPKWKENVVVGAMSGVMSIGSMKARGEVWSPDNPDQPIEKRIEAIVNNLDRIRTEQTAHYKSIEELRDSHEEHKKNVAKENKSMEENIRTDLESLHTSDLTTSLVGLIWLTVGISMSTMAPELFWLAHLAK
jgi:hypothetical protein